MNSTTTTPWFLAEIIATTPGNADPSWAAGRHVYVRVRAGAVDVRGAGGVFARVSLAQAKARIRTVRDAAGCRTLVRGQRQLDEAYEAWVEVEREWRHRRPARAA